jgi:hypothetical protein
MTFSLIHFKALKKQAGSRDTPLSGFFYCPRRREFMANGKYYTIKPGDTLSLIVAQNPDLGYANWKELRDANHSEIMRVGYEQMATLGISPDTPLRQPCGLSGHSAPNHLIDGGVHYDEPGVPTIYPGTTLFLKNKPEPLKRDIPPPSQEEFSAPELIHKSRWAGVESQSPGPKLEIFTSGDQNNPDFTYTAELKEGAYSKFLGYNFIESTDSLEGSFSFTIENEEIDADRQTVFDLIPNRSVIKIYEGDLKRAAFVGIVRSRELGAAMTGQGVKRTITFSGKSIISCIAEYTISLNIKIQGVADAVSRNHHLTDQLARDGVTMKDFMKETWDYFMKIANDVSKEQNGIATTALTDVINKYIGDSDKFIRVLGKEQELRYNVACVFFRAATNTITDVWKNILPENVYELFSRCDDGEPKIIARQVPFGDPDNGNNDWGELPIYLISPISLTGYKLKMSDEEVYTAFASYIIGSPKSRDFYMAERQTAGKDSTVAYSQKCSIHGFKPLEIDFNGYDRAGNTRNAKLNETINAVQTLNKRAAYWYSRLDDMYSGSITIITDFNEPHTNPRAGCRAKFIGAEFYIKSGEHSWTYGGTPTIRLSVSRGMIYDNQGKMKPGEEGVIKNLGRRFRELEVEGA